ncbi:MAG: tetratricopeptide repeat protein [Bryobacterales bacterium]|nr:tetratricopeptide repeat protein [Bryobacteraceae bacterium]MDW8355439.1 tetratricopeptide repeat protein [Bryobacterales bacterium]
MAVRLSNVTRLAIMAVFGLASAFAQQAERQWKDRAEYDLYVAITKEADPNKKLQLLNEWRQKYPQTAFAKERLQLFLFTYQALNQPAQMVEAAQEILALDPKDFQALYWMTLLTPTLGKATPDVLSNGEKAAKGLLGALDETFALEKKPAATSEADWKNARKDSEALAYRTLGWIAMVRKQPEQAEEYFTKALQLEPSAASLPFFRPGDIAYWLGSVLIAQKVPEKQMRALFHFARAASYDGAGSLTPQGRQDVNKYLEKVYAAYHGSLEGLDQIRQMARTQPLPPADFKIKSAAEIAMEKEEELRKANPMLALWLSVKKELTAEGGEQYFQERVKQALLPGAAVPGVTKFRGRLVAAKPPRNPKELVLAISDATTPEVTLRLEEPLAGTAEPGTEISFAGVAAEFTRNPFMLTFEVEKGQVEGWPAPAPKKAPAVKKKTGKKS